MATGVTQGMAGISSMHQGKTYIVTGVASGIGEATCAGLRSAGARVIGVDLEITNITDEQFQVDLANPNSIDRLVSCLPEGTDGLANIAGVPPTRSADQVLKVNLYGLRRLTNSLVPKLADGASIVNIASLAGTGWPDAIEQVRRTIALDFDDDIQEFCSREGLYADTSGRAYFLSKEALVVWTMQNRWTWRERGINMNCVSPGPVETPILGDFIDTFGDRFTKNMKVMDRIGTPADIVPIIMFALSDAAKWCRGANFAVDGGVSSHILSGIHQF